MHESDLSGIAFGDCRLYLDDKCTDDSGRCSDRRSASGIRFGRSDERSTKLLCRSQRLNSGDRSNDVHWDGAAVDEWNEYSLVLAESRSGWIGNKNV